MLSRQHKHNTLITLLIKAGAISFLLLLSILIVACSGSGGSQVDPGTPIATVTINLGQGSPMPPLKDYYCGGWATDTSPAFNPTSFVSVFGKFTHIMDDGNPEGVGGAQATANIQWLDGTSEPLTATTTSDGLAVFPVAIKPSMLNKLVTISITFTITLDTKLITCTIPSAAYFTAILLSPMPTNTALPSSTATGTPSVTPTPGGTVTPTGTPRSTPTPKPTKHP